MNAAELYKMIFPLSDRQRWDARLQAREAVAYKTGQKPTRQQFASEQFSTYPPAFERGVYLAIALVLLAAFLPSAFRLFAIGRQGFLEGLPIGWQATIAGFSMVVLAEASVILFSVAVLQAQKQRWLFYLGMALGAAIAIVGNVQLALNPASPFSWLETLAPPIITLLAGQALKTALIAKLSARHHAERKYQAALEQWANATADPENSPLWEQAYLLALKDAIITANSAGRGKADRIALLEGLDRDQWGWLLYRELEAERWAVSVPGAQQQQQPVEVEGAEHAFLAPGQERGER